MSLVIISKDAGDWAVITRLPRTEFPYQKLEILPSGNKEILYILVNGTEVHTEKSVLMKIGIKKS